MQESGYMKVLLSYFWKDENKHHFQDKHPDITLVHKFNYRITKFPTKNLFKNLLEMILSKQRHNTVCV